MLDHGLVPTNWGIFQTINWGDQRNLAIGSNRQPITRQDTDFAGGPDERIGQTKRASAIGHQKMKIEHVLKSKKR